MTSPLYRGLIVLERAPTAERLVLQVFGTVAEADADLRPLPYDGAAVVRIITGVPRLPGTGVS